MRSYLFVLFDCHINAQMCSTIKLVIYLHKYVFKGHDLVLFNLTSKCDHDTFDEINHFREGR